MRFVVVNRQNCSSIAAGETQASIGRIRLIRDRSGGYSDSCHILQPHSL
jgi:hypothetical protein